MTDQQIAPVEQPRQRVSASAMAMLPVGQGGVPMPATFGEVCAFADIMSRSQHAIPKHLRDNPGACLAVTMQAMRWEMDPFAVASKTYNVKDLVAYEAQVISAVINTRAGLVSRPSIEFKGEGDKRQCVVTGVFTDGSTHVYTSPEVSKITTKNSPLWKSDEDQQLGYYSVRNFGRRHCPEVIMGVYDRDEIEHSDAVAPTTGRRAKADLQGKLTADKAGEGFNADHVASETADKASDAVIEGKAEEAEQKPNAVEVRKEALRIAQEKGEAAYQAALADDQEALTALQDGAVTEEQSDFIRNGILKAEGELADQREKGEEDTVDAGMHHTEIVETDDDQDDIETLRLTAYEDGFRGEPVQVILSECETDDERKAAVEEHERGVQARIAKEAAEHHASDEITFDFEVVGGAAPKGDGVYLLTTDEPGKDGKLPTYKSGTLFSRAGPKGANALKAYDGHSEPTDQSLASQGGGTASPEEAQERGGLFAEMAAKESWLAIKPELSKIYGTPEFKELSPEEQAATRAKLFGAVLEMKDRTKDPVDWAADPTAFALFADYTAARKDIDPKEAADMIDGTFQTLQGSKLWSDKLSPAVQDMMVTRVAGIMHRLRS